MFSNNNSKRPSNFDFSCKPRHLQGDWHYRNGSMPDQAWGPRLPFNKHLCQVGVAFYPSYKHPGQAWGRIYPSCQHHWRAWGWWLNVIVSNMAYGAEFINLLCKVNLTNVEISITLISASSSLACLQTTLWHALIWKFLQMLHF